MARNKHHGDVRRRAAGVLLLLVAGAAAGVWAWRHHPVLRPFD